MASTQSAPPAEWRALRVAMAKSRADSVVRAIEQFGDKWTVLILRQAFFGVGRYRQIQRNTGISYSSLTKRLGALVDNGILERRKADPDDSHHEYVLTEKGQDLFQPIVAIMRWGDRYCSGSEGPPMILDHNDCGEDAKPHVVCSKCGGTIEHRNVTPRPGPGADLPPHLLP